MDKYLQFSMAAHSLDLNTVLLSFSVIFIINILKIIF